MNLRGYVLAALQTYRSDIPEAMSPASVRYALSRDYGVTATLADVKRTLSTLRGDHLAWHYDDGTWTARVAAPRRVRGDLPSFRVNGTAPHRVRRSDAPMRGPVLLFIPLHDPDD